MNIVHYGDYWLHIQIIDNLLIFVQWHDDHVHVSHVDLQVFHPDTNT